MEAQQQLDRLTGIVESLAASVVEHDDQIGNLITVAQKLQDVAQKHQEEIAELRRLNAETASLWQAYLKRLPPQ